MSDSTTLPCVCCDGVARETPAAIFNRPGLSQIAYRVGTHASFKASLLASLTDPDLPGARAADHARRQRLLHRAARCVRRLGRHPDLLPGAARQRICICAPRCSRARCSSWRGWSAISPRPGVAASAPLAITLNDAPGRARPGGDPGGDASAERAAAGPVAGDVRDQRRPRRAHRPQRDPADPGAAGGLGRRSARRCGSPGPRPGCKPGDAILLVDVDRVGDPDSQVWEFRTVTAVSTDAPNNRTLIAWDVALFPYLPDQRDRRAALRAAPPRLAVRRQRARSEARSGTCSPTRPTATGRSSTTRAISISTRPMPGWRRWPRRRGLRHRARSASPGWCCRTARERRLYRVLAAADRAPLRYTLSAKATGLTLDTRLSGSRGSSPRTRLTTVFIGSEPLAIAPQPLIDWRAPHRPGSLAPGMLRPVAGSGETVAGGAMLVAGQTVAVTGKRARLQLATGATPRTWSVADGVRRSRSCPATWCSPTPIRPTTLASGQTVWQRADHAGCRRDADGDSRRAHAAAGRQGGSGSRARRRCWTPSRRRAAGQTALTFATSARPHLRPRDGAVQRQRRGRDAWRDGAGDPRQRRRLAAEPELHPEAVAADLSERAERPGRRLHAAGLGERSALARAAEPARRGAPRPGLRDAQQASGHRRRCSSATARTARGRRPGRPTCARSTARGSAWSGNVPAGGISQAIDRPPGLRSVSNPADATGGADPDTPADARASAPLHVLTLERVVSLQDYQDFVRGLRRRRARAGDLDLVGAHARRGRHRGRSRRRGARSRRRDHRQSCRRSARCRQSLCAGHRAAAPASSASRLAGLVRVDTANYDPALVLAAVRAALLAAFGFAARDARPGRRAERGDRGDPGGAGRAGRQTHPVHPRRRRRPCCPTSFPPPHRRPAHAAR